ncbi:MAG: hypothetical protein RI957_130 [Verrucomicrobiota bacterium]|jgi:hypothetical protein
MRFLSVFLSINSIEMMCFDSDGNRFFSLFRKPRQRFFGEGESQSVS